MLGAKQSDMLLAILQNGLVWWPGASWYQVGTAAQRRDLARSLEARGILVRETTDDRIQWRVHDPADAWQQAGTAEARRKTLANCRRRVAMLRLVKD